MSFRNYFGNPLFVVLILALLNSTDIAVETGGAVRFDDWVEHFKGEKVNGNAEPS